jgi:hypothetical protein
MELDTQWERIVRDPETPTETLEKIFYALHEVPTEDSSVHEYYKLIAQHSNAPFSVLETVIFDWSWKDLAAVVASNPDTPKAILERLVAHKDWKVIWGLCANPATPRWVLELLANLEDYEERVMWNPSLATELESAFEHAHQSNLDVEEIFRLSRSSFPRIREAIAGNAQTPIVILEQLAHDKQWCVRRGVAKNLNTPAFILAKLADDEDPADGYCEVPCSVASNPNAPIPLLEKLAMYEYNNMPVEDVRLAATNNLQSKYP